GATAAAAALSTAESKNGTPVSITSRTMGLPQVAVPEGPAPAAAVAVDARAAAAWAPADVPAMVEEPLGRGALVAKQKSHQKKKQSTGAREESRMTLTQKYRVPSVPGARTSSLAA